MLEPNLKRTWLHIGKNDRSSDKKGLEGEILGCLIWVVVNECVHLALVAVIICASFWKYFIFKKKIVKITGVSYTI